MSKLKNPSRLSRRLGCWDNPSGHKTCRCTQWRITGRRISVTFLIFSALTETYLENYEWTWFNITISYHPSFASFITLHPFHWQLLQCQVFTLLYLLQHWTIPPHTIFSAILYKKSTSPPLPPLTYWSCVCPRCIVLHHICNQYPISRCIYSSYGRLQLWW